ncbi:AI-2E family transporter [Candidatus Saccharibacteria bacterium]|nr:AI-2E family transporter [Candidatus Saccharibacteria bacterium]
MSREKSIVVKVDTWTFVRFWLVVVAFLAAAWILWSIRAGLVIILTALFFSVILNPLVSLIARRIGGKSKRKRRTLAILISYILVVAVVGGVIAAITPLVISQVKQFFEIVPDMIEGSNIGLSSLAEFAERHGVGEYLHEMIDGFRNSMHAILGDFQGGILSGAGSLMSFFTSFFVVVVLTYLFLSEGSVLMKQFWEEHSNSPSSTKLQRTFSRIAKAFSDYAQGQLLVAVLAAFSSAVIISILSFFSDVPIGFAIPLGLFLGVMGLIPVFGSFIGGVLASILLLFSSLPAAISFLVLYFIYQQIENNIIMPRIQAKRSAISPLIVLVAVTIGLFAGGIAGAILAVPITSCLKIIYEEYGGAIKHRVKKVKG